MLKGDKIRVVGKLYQTGTYFLTYRQFECGSNIFQIVQLQIQMLTPSFDRVFPSAMKPSGTAPRKQYLYALCLPYLEWKPAYWPLGVICLASAPLTDTFNFCGWLIEVDLEYLTDITALLFSFT